MNKINVETFLPYAYISDYSWFLSMNSVKIRLSTAVLCSSYGMFAQFPMWFHTVIGYFFAKTNKYETNHHAWQILKIPVKLATGRSKKKYRIEANKCVNFPFLCVLLKCHQNEKKKKPTKQTNNNIDKMKCRNYLWNCKWIVY